MAVLYYKSTKTLAFFNFFDQTHIFSLYLSLYLKKYFETTEAFPRNKIMDKLYESSTSEGTQLGMRLASTTLENRGKKRAAEQMEEADDNICLKVKSQEKEIHFKVKRNIKLQKILKVFCDIARVKYRTMRFLIDGSRVPPTATPAELNMTDGDEIEVMIHAGGGGNAAVI